MTTPECAVIVGAGQAGARTALALRARGWEGRVVLVGAEAHVPYERPPLSKRALTTPGWQATLIAEPLRYVEQRIELRLRTRATALDTAARCVTLAGDDGRQELLKYDKLVLATGGRPRRLYLPGACNDRALTLRDKGDAARLAGRLAPGQVVAVIGGGFIGLEVAASARQRGCDVVLIEAGPRLLGRAVPASLAALVHGLHDSRGVDIRLRTVPVAIEAAGERIGIQCALGQGIEADTLVAGIGMVPDLALAINAGLAVRRGIVVDRMLMTSAPDVYAAGDVCEFPSTRNGDTATLESWANAEGQAEAVARHITGGAEPYVVASWMWSDQYDHSLQMIGRCIETVSVATRLLPEGRLDFHLDADRRIVGVAGFAPSSSLARPFLLARRLVETRAQRSLTELTDPAVSLKSLVAA